MGRPLDLTGRVFSRLTVIEFAGVTRVPSGYTVRQWRCQCECGGVKTVTGRRLVSGTTKSCGCWSADRLRALRTRHGHCRVGQQAPTHKSWQQMIDRCHGTANPRYGGRGIAVCERWRTYEHFLADMGPRPAGHSLDRINTDGNYEPGNCRWATEKEQQNNRSTNVRVTFQGREMTVSQVADLIGIPSRRLHDRFRRHGRDIDATIASILTHPPATLDHRQTFHAKIPTRTGL